MSLRDWFGAVELETLEPAQQAFLDELEQMLGAYKPPLLDTTRSSIRDRGHAWTKANTIEIRLVHATEPDAAIVVGLSPDEAIIGWLTSHEHITASDEWNSRSWTAAAVDAVAAILRGDYVVEDTYRGRRLVKTRIIDVGDPEGPHWITETGSLFAWIPTPGTKRVERRRIGFGARWRVGPNER